jgi:short-subunit dehydrogenase
MGVKLPGQAVLLTGASSGIGHALARRMASNGARLAITARREARLHELADWIERGGRVRPVVLPGDLSQRGAAARLASEAREALGRVDVLVNNAGGGVGGSQWAVGDRDEARAAFELDLWSPLALTAALVPTMRERGGGAIVNVTSVAQVMTLWGMGHGIAAKAALARATETLRLELTGTGVHVLEVIPGSVNTAIQGEVRLIPGAEQVMRASPLGDPDRFARLIVRALARGRKRLVYPRTLRLSYELPAVPRLYMSAMARLLRRELDVDDPRVVVSGSQGDELAREARAAWERTRGQA